MPSVKEFLRIYTIGIDSDWNLSGNQSIRNNNSISNFVDQAYTKKVAQSPSKAVDNIPQIKVN